MDCCGITYNQAVQALRSNDWDLWQAEVAIRSERMLHFMHGILSKDEPRKYCSEACAEKDQMAHEL
ncbi:hypothetical protein DWG87_11120 [Escherichia coli]|nr:hypothetical protein [Escherichia coli]